MSKQKILTTTLITITAILIIVNLQNISNLASLNPKQTTPNINETISQQHYTNSQILTTANKNFANNDTNKIFQQTNIIHQNHLEALTPNKPNKNNTNKNNQNNTPTNITELINQTTQTANQAIQDAQTTEKNLATLLTSIGISRFLTATQIAKQTQNPPPQIIQLPHENLFNPKQTINKETTQTIQNLIKQEFYTFYAYETAIPQLNQEEKTTATTFATQHLETAQTLQQILLAHEKQTILAEGAYQLSIQPTNNETAKQLLQLAETELTENYLKLVSLTTNDLRNFAINNTSNSATRNYYWENNLPTFPGLQN